jgi:hypothetical protein
MNLTTNKFWALLFMASLMAFSSCGDDDSSSSSLNGEILPDEAQVDENGNAVFPDGIEFKGYVASAFELTVDGVTYQDMEDFYTQERERLQEKVIAAGYEDDWEAAFNAEIGLTDLWHNMTVFIAPVDKRGYQGESFVSRGGEFSISLPQDASAAEYKVRANKRISVVLRRGDEQIEICYNFLALDKSVLFDEKEKPIILDQFESRITKYSCQSESGSGVVVPSAEPKKSATGPKLKKGMPKAQALELMGEEYLSIESEVKWCFTASDIPPMCVDWGDFNCSCSVTFDADGLVAAQDNVNATYLNILSW